MWHGRETECNGEWKTRMQKGEANGLFHCLFLSTYVVYRRCIIPQYVYMYKYMIPKADNQPIDPFNARAPAAMQGGELHRNNGMQTSLPSFLNCTVQEGRDAAVFTCRLPVLVLT